MKYFLTLLFLEWKRSFCSRSKLSCAACLLLITLIFGALLPSDAPASTIIGVFAQGIHAETTFDILAQNKEYRMQRYDSLEAMRKDLIAGGLHCAYHIQPQDVFTKPVTVYETQASYLRSLIDQLVLSAHFEAGVPSMTEKSFEKYGVTRSDKAVKGNEMTVKIIKLGKTTEATPTSSQSIQPMVYAVLVSLLCVVSVLQALLMSASTAKAHSQLAALSGRRIASLLAPAFAEATFWVLMLFICDQILMILFAGQIYYPFMGRFTLFLLLAVFSTILSFTTKLLHSGANIIVLLLPLWLFVSVFFSGALFPVEQLPFSLGGLRFLSPAWYALHWMGLF